MQRGYFVNKTQLSLRAVILVPAVNQDSHYSVPSPLNASRWFQDIVGFLNGLWKFHRITMNFVLDCR
jgi:hypothetical protein